MEIKKTVSAEAATEQISGWLDFKKVPKAKREKEDAETIIETLTEAVVDGKLEVLENNHLKVHLDFPVEDDEGSTVLSTIMLKSRITVQAINKAVRTSKAKTPEDKIAVYLSVLSGHPKALIEKVDTTDYALLGAIVVFFL